MNRVLAQEKPQLGDSLLVDAVIISGDPKIEPDELLERIETKKSSGGFARFLWSISPRLPLAGEPQYFDADIFQRDLEALQQLYTNSGYFSAEIKGKYERIPGKRRIRATIDIQAGQRSIIDSVDYRNLRGLPAEIDSLIRFGRDRVIRPGNPYHADDVEAEVQRVLAILGNAGYPGAVCEDRIVEIKQSTRNVLVRFPFRFGRRLKVGSIDIAVMRNGRLNLARRIIDDRIELEPGAWYSPRKRERSETNLNRLGIFSDVQVLVDIPPLDDTTRDVVPVTVAFALRKQHDVIPALIVNNQYGRLNGGAEVSYVFRNAFGGAQTLTAKANFISKVDLPIDAYQAAAQVQVDQPYFIDNDNSARLGLAYILAHEAGLYGGDILQTTVGATRRFTDRVQGTVDWVVEQSRYDIIASGQSLVNTPFAPYDTTGINYRNSIITFGYDRDYTNDFFNPTAGYSLKGTVEEAGLFKQVIPAFFRGYRSTEYVKLEGLVRWFRDLSRNATTISGFKLRAGFLFRYGDSKASSIPVPFNRRYYAGGAQSIRGWSSRSLAAGGGEHAGFGGNAIIETNAEIRWQPFPARKGKRPSMLENIWLVLFGDAGNLWDEPYAVRLRECAIAGGMGLRYNLFFGPIRIDYGMRVYDPAAAERPWCFQRSFWKDVFKRGQIHLGIGHAF